MVFNPMATAQGRPEVRRVEGDDLRPSGNIRSMLRFVDRIPGAVSQEVRLWVDSPVKVTTRLPPPAPLSPSKRTRVSSPDSEETALVPKRFKADKDDYRPELCHLLCQLLEPADINPVYAQDDKNQGKHSSLYAFIALCLVRESRSDVAAIAVYHLDARDEVYWSKNSNDPAVDSGMSPGKKGAQILGPSRYIQSSC
jgi:hypothetical protein